MNNRDSKSSENNSKEIIKKNLSKNNLNNDMSFIENSNVGPKLNMKLLEGTFNN